MSGATYHRPRVVLRPWHRVNADPPKQIASGWYSHRSNFGSLCRIYRWSESPSIQHPTGSSTASGPFPIFMVPAVPVVIAAGHVHHHHSNRNTRWCGSANRSTAQSPRPTSHRETHSITAIAHSLAETCAARLWVMLRLGHAETDQSTGQQDREKFCSLTPLSPPDRRLRDSLVDSQRPDKAVSIKAVGASGNRPFLFLSHFRSDNSHMKRPRDMLHFSLGDVLCFLLFLSLLLIPCISTVHD